MMNLIRLLAGAALLSLLNATAFAQIDESKLTTTNNRPLPIEIPLVVPKSNRQRIKLSISPPETVQYVPGTSLVLECQFKGEPAPVAEWLKNGELVSNFGEDIFPINHHCPAFLISKFVILAASDGDVFTCVGISGLKRVRASTTVYVEGGGSDSLLNQMMPSKPIVSVFYTDLFPTEGSSVTLRCRVLSPTATQVMWTDNKNKVVDANGRVRVLPSGDLHITGVRWADTGRWTCSVENAFGRDVVETFLYPFAQKKDTE